MINKQCEKKKAFLICINYNINMLCVVCRFLRSLASPCLVGKSCSRTHLEKQHMHGSLSMICILMVTFTFSICYIYIPLCYMFSTLHFWLISEQEAKWLRHYIDEPNYTDLQWVISCHIFSTIHRITKSMCGHDLNYIVRVDSLGNVCPYYRRTRH